MAGVVGVRAEQAAPHVTDHEEVGQENQRRVDRQPTRGASHTTPGAGSGWVVVRPVREGTSEGQHHAPGASADTPRRSRAARRSWLGRLFSSPALTVCSARHRVP